MNSDRDWESLALPWMTAEEEGLYRQLSESEKQMFKGFFIARRLEDPATWSKTGMYLPEFFCKVTHGDIRDQLLHVLGEPKGSTHFPLNPNLPSAWHFDQFELRFLPQGGKHISLDRSSALTWDTVKQGFIKHPKLRYDFMVKSFGRTRLPDDIDIAPVEIASSFLVPEDNGGTLTVNIPIPKFFRDQVAQTSASPVQNMEMHVRLRRPGTVGPNQVVEVRHASHRLNVLEEQYLSSACLCRLASTMPSWWCIRVSSSRE